MSGFRGIYTSEELPEMLHDLEYDYRRRPGAGARDRDGGARARDACDGEGASQSADPLPDAQCDALFQSRRQDRRVLSIGVCQTASVKNDLTYRRAIGEAICEIESACGAGRFGRDVAQILGLRSNPGSRIGIARGYFSSTANRAYDERIMDWLRLGRHDAVLGHAADDFRAHCSPEGRFSHYLMMAGAMGGDSMELARRAIRQIRSGTRHRPGDLLFRNRPND